MKLKLDSHGEVTILSVIEAIEIAHVAILKAGISKLIYSDKKVILLDLTGLKDGDIQAMAVFREIQTFQTWAQESGAQFVTASQMPGLGQTSTREEGLRILCSPLARIQTREARLKLQQAHLQQQKETLEQKLNSADTVDLKPLHRENSDLKIMIQTLESQIQYNFKRRLEPMQSIAMKTKIDSIHQLLTAVLEQDGVLPIT